MRMNLKVPFAEKEEAKKLGARWDAAMKLWYVISEGDLDAFSRWSPMSYEESTASQPSKAIKAVKVQAAVGKVYIGSDYLPLARICDCPPWEVCVVCSSTALPR